jgi:hypothetical protein
MCDCERSRQLSYHDRVGLLLYSIYSCIPETVDIEKVGGVSYAETLSGRRYVLNDTMLAFFLSILSVFFENQFQGKIITPNRKIKYKSNLSTTLQQY